MLELDSAFCLDRNNQEKELQTLAASYLPGMVHLRRVEKKKEK